MRHWWYSNKLGGFSNVTGEPPIENNYKFIGVFDKEVNINSNMYLLKCTDSEAQIVDTVTMSVIERWA